MELRCVAKKHGELEDGFLEVKCSSRFCGAAPGIVVLHRFDALTGKLLNTNRFRDPGPEVAKEDRSDTTDRTAVRSP
jgi:hypothetical protein